MTDPKTPDDTDPEKKTPDVEDVEEVTSTDDTDSAPEETYTPRDMVAEGVIAAGTVAGTVAGGLKDPTSNDVVEDASEIVEEVTDADELTEAAADADPAETEDESPADEEPAEPVEEEPTEPVEETETTDDGAQEEYEEEHEGTSFAARALTLLVVFLLGGAAFIWGAPRVAPMLPAGMAPVAEWLTPGQAEAEASIASLRADLEAQIGALDTGLTPDGVTGEINATVGDAVGALTDETRARIDALSDQLTATDSGAIEQRLSQVETRLEGLVGELTALRRELTGLAETNETTSETAAASLASNTEQIAAFNAALEGLQAEIDTLAGQNGALSQRIDEVAATAERQLREAEESVAEAEEQAAAQVLNAAAQADINGVSAALASGAPFNAHLATIGSLTDIPEALSRAAETGVPTLASLQEELPDLAHQAIQESVVESGQNEGGLSSLTAFIRSRVSGRSLVEIEGTTPDAILSRVEARTNEGDLSAAVTEAKTLPAVAQAVLSAWITDAETRQGALEAFGQITAELGASN